MTVRIGEAYSRSNGVSASKLSTALLSRKAMAAPDDLIEVVVEMRPTAVAAAAPGKAGIEARKLAFDRDSAPIDEAVRKAGGRVLGRVWLNHTLKALVPARALDGLSGLTVIQALDVPTPLRPEAG